MDFLATLPRRSWLERAALALAGLGLALGLCGLWDSWLGLGQLPVFKAGQIAFRRDETLALAFLGIALFSKEIGSRGVFWTGLVPLLVGLRGVFTNLTGRELDWGGWIDAASHTEAPLRLANMTAACLVLGGTALVINALYRGPRVWNEFDRVPHGRIFSTALVGSLIGSVGLSTLFGYVANLPLIYHWADAIPVPVCTGAAFLVFGVALVGIAWRENRLRLNGPPAWSPMPAILACLTLTLVLWLGLRESDRSAVTVRTQSAMNQIANAIHYELQAQLTSLERLARRWSDGPDFPIAWEADAALQLSDTRPLGCARILFLDRSARTRWIYPKAGNEALYGFPHRGEPARSEAIDVVLKTLGPNLTSTTPVTVESQGFRASGFVVYTPLLRAGVAEGLVAAEFLYKPFFQQITTKRSGLSEDYHFTITIGRDLVYESVKPAGSDDGILPLEKIYNFPDRRIRIGASPTAESLGRDRRYFPEIALVTGFGFTALLGLSIHLARRARSGQSSVEASNRKLTAEITERSRIEERLKVSDERLRLALDSTQIGIIEWQVAAGQVYISPGLWALLGYAHTEMAGTIAAWQALVHPDDLPLYRRRIESQLLGDIDFIDPEYRVQSQSGEWRWMQMRSKTVGTGPDGRPLRIIGTVQDITARRTAEQALRQSQAEARKLSLVASKTDNPVIIGTPDGLIEWVNDAFCRVMEYSLAEVIGKNPIEFLVGAATNPRTIVRIRAAMARGLGVSTDIVNYSKSGRKYHLHLEIQPIRNTAGTVETFIALLTDITARVESEAALRRAKAEADSASSAKSEFLASMSHEIRTPMNGVIGMTSLLMETKLSHEQRDYVNTVRTSGEALLTIINDILDFSKIESGKMELERIPFDLALCIEEALDLFALQASAKKIEIGYHLAPDVPAWIVGDITRLRQVLVNLFNNAVKFTPSGSIFIEVRRPTVPYLGAAAAHRFSLEFSIRDTGIGIPPDRLDRLFKAFSQVDSSTTRKYGGTGLGLVICQRLSQLMGGDIRVESTPGTGSAFTFTIATEAASFSNSGLPALPKLPARLLTAPVLIVEPHPLAQAHLRSCFSQWGAVTCIIAPDAAAAAALLPSLPVPPVLLLIVGSVAAGSARLDPLAALLCPRLVMFPFGQTAPSTPVNFPAPFDALPKPIKHAALYHAVINLFGKGGRTYSPFALSGERPLAAEFPLSVLLAEDNPVNQKVATRFLERLGYRAVCVVNGLEAVEAFSTRSYDLVLMDLQMPEMDGLEASRQIRQLPLERQPKIIALTANAMQGDRELCLAAGMDDYVTKPVKIQEISAAIRRQFGPAAVPQTIG